MNYRLQFALLLVPVAIFTALIFIVWVLMGNTRIEKWVYNKYSTLADKAFSGWSSYYDALESEFFNNPFIESDHKEKYVLQDSYSQRKKLLDAYETDFAENWKKIESLFI